MVGFNEWEHHVLQRNTHQLSTSAGKCISAIIPAYNAAAFLPRCLASVFAQTCPPDEVIVVDDGSTDDTASVAGNLGAKVISRPNGGLSAARNTGVNHARGEFIALLDADDWWAADKLEKQMAVFAPGTVLVYTGIFSTDGKRMSSIPAMDPASALEALRFGNPITPSTVVVRREALLQAGGFREDIRACEDWDMWVRLLDSGTFACVTEPLTYYYMHPNSLSANPDRMLHAVDQILDSTLLHGLSPWSRPIWRRRILAVQLLSAGLIARENGLPTELKYVLRSISTWPSPWWQPKRFAALAVTLRNQARKAFSA